MLKYLLTATVKNNHCSHVLSVTKTKNIRCQSTLVDIKKKMARILDEAAVGKYGSRDTVKEILKLRQELKSNNIPPDPSVYDYMLSAYSKADDVSKVLFLMREMRSELMKPTKTFYHNALRLAGRTGDADVQGQVLDEMQKRGFPKTSSVYQYMITCMCNNMELERALDTMDEMKKMNLLLTATDSANMINLAVKLNQPDLAFELLTEGDTLRRNLEKHPFFTIHVLRGLILSGTYHNIKACWNYAVSEKVFDTCPPDEGVCLGVLNAAGKSGDPHLASDVIRLLGQLGFNYRDIHFAPLLEAFTLAGEIDKAFEIFDIMRKVGVIPTRQVISPMVRLFSQDSKAAIRAKECLDKKKAENQEVDIVAFNLVLHVLSHNKKSNDVFDMFENHKDYKVEPNVETLDAILDACIHLKDLEKGREIYNKEIGAGITPTSRTLSKMVTLACTQEGDYEDAFQYLEEMKHNGLIPLRGCYYRLVKRLSESQDPRLQLALDDMKEYGYEISSHLKNYMLLKKEQFEEQEQHRKQFMSALVNE